MKTILAWVGAAAIVVAILPLFGLGNFRLYYGSDLPATGWCAKGQL